MLFLIFMKSEDFFQITFQRGTCHDVEANPSSISIFFDNLFLTVVRKECRMTVKALIVNFWRSYFYAESFARETADLVTFTEEILNGKLHFLCSDSEVLL